MNTNCRRENLLVSIFRQQIVGNKQQIDFVKIKINECVKMKNFYRNRSQKRLYFLGNKL